MPFKADIDYVKKRKNDALERSLHFNIAGGEKKGKFVHLQWHIRIRVCGILLKNEWKTKKKTKNTWIMWSEHGISVRCSHLRRKSHLMIDCVTRHISHVQSIGLVINSFANCNSRFFCTVCIGFSSIQIHLNDMRIFAPAILNCIQLVGGHLRYDIRTESAKMLPSWILLLFKYIHRHSRLGKVVIIVSINLGEYRATSLIDLESLLISTFSRSFMTELFTKCRF